MNTINKIKSHKIHERNIDAELLKKLYNGSGDLAPILNGYWSKEEKIPEGNIDNIYTDKISQSLIDLKNTFNDYRAKNIEITTDDIEDNLIKRIEYLEEKIDFLYTQDVDVDTVSKQVDIIIKQLDLQGAVVEAVKQEIIEDINKQIDSVDEQINILTANIAAVEGKVTNNVRLKTDAITLSDIDASFAIKLESIEADISSNKDSITSLLTSVTDNGEYESISGDFDFNLHTDQEYKYYLDEPENFIDGPCDKKGFFNCVIVRDGIAIRHIYVDIDGRIYTRIGTLKEEKELCSWYSSDLDKNAYTDNESPSAGDTTYSTRQGTVWSSVSSHNSTDHTITDANGDSFTYSGSITVQVHDFDKWIQMPSIEDLEPIIERMDSIDEKLESINEKLDLIDEKILELSGTATA